MSFFSEAVKKKINQLNKISPHRRVSNFTQRVVETDKRHIN